MADHPDFAAGLALFAQGRMAEAVACLHRAAGLAPDQAPVHHALGLALLKAGDHDRAAQSLSAACALAPQDTDIRAALIQVLWHLQRWPDVLAHLTHLPVSADSLADQALVLNQLGRWAEAETKARAALLLVPGHGAATNNLGLALGGQDRLQQAEALFRTLPKDAEARNNLAYVLTKQGRLQEALAVYTDLLADRDTPQVRFNLAHARLLAGDLRQGLADYESRLQDHTSALPRRDFAQPRWQGEDWTGKTLLIHAEQGFGDSLQFCRLVPHLATRGRVVLEVPQTLVELLRCLPGNITLVARGQGLPPFDLQCPLISLGHAMGLELADVSGKPYLRADAGRQDHWRQRLAAHGGLRVGVVWQGNPAHANDRKRSVPVAELAPLWQVPGIAWFSLQMEGGGPGLDLSPHMTSFAESAAMVANLDLIITIDSAMAHLAGALGVPCWVLLPHAPDWRWLTQRPDSPWYDSVRLFRQPRPGDWAALVRQVSVQLTPLTGHDDRNVALN